MESSKILVSWLKSKNTCTYIMENLGNSTEEFLDVDSMYFRSVNAKLPGYPKLGWILQDISKPQECVSVYYFFSLLDSIGLAVTI